MPSHQVRVRAIGVPIAIGDRLGITHFPVGIDHASLVTALRSRSDGRDWRLMYQGVQVPFSINNVGTAAATFEFQSAVRIEAGFDDYYQLLTGDLGLTWDPFSSIPGSPVAAAHEITVTITALSLPRPGWTVERTRGDDVLESPFPESLTVLRRQQNQNAVQTFRVNYPHISGDELYEIRALWNSTRGTAGTFVTPSWLVTLGATYANSRFVDKPNTVYASALDHQAACVIEEVVA